VGYQEQRKELEKPLNGSSERLVFEFGRQQAKKYPNEFDSFLNSKLDIADNCNNSQNYNFSL
jgi:hypothetical protein